MCGVVGVIDFLAAPEACTVNIGGDTLRHRGPDDQGSWVHGAAAFGHARLSVLDLSNSAAQPMISSNGRYALVYNGEVYNYRELAMELAHAGIELKSRSDTEVLLEAFCLWGEAVIPRLNGIFAFGIWDLVEERLTLCRDRFGVKPLYFVVEGLRLVFGSELKAVFAMSSFRPRIDRWALHELLYFGTGGLGSRTILEGMRKLEPGCVVRFDRSGLQTSRYWSVVDVESQSDGVGAAAERVRVLLNEAVARQLVSDVPVAVFLSGGVDSSAVTAYASRHHTGPLRTYAVGFDFAGDADELPKAARVAKHFGTDHREVFLRGADLASVVEALVVQHDGPFSDAANIPLYLLCRELRGTFKVVLQGDGGDELFGGYRRYVLLRRARLWALVARSAGWLLPRLPISREKGTRLARMIEIWQEADESTRMALLLAQDGRNPSPARLLARPWRDELCRTDPFARYRDVGKELRNLEPVQRMLLTDMQILLPDIFLEKVDRATMAHGVEARVPFLDNLLTGYVLGLPSGTKMPGGRPKGLLKQALRGVVPDFVLDGPKVGFGVPYSRWLAGPLAAFARERICEGSAATEGLIDRASAGTALDDHVAGRADHGFLLWKYLNLAIWVEHYRSSIVL